MKICLTTYFDTSFHILGSLAEPTFQRYAYRHNIDYIRAKEVPCSRPIAWAKILIVKDLLLKGYDQVIWIDSDAMLMRTNEDIRDSLKKGKHFHIVGRKVVVDGRVQIRPNSGFFIIDNSDWSLNFLDEVWSRSEFTNHRWWENAAILAVLANRITMEGNLDQVGWLNQQWNDRPEECNENTIVKHYAGYCSSSRFDGMLADYRQIFKTDPNFAAIEDSLYKASA